MKQENNMWSYVKNSRWAIYGQTLHKLDWLSWGLMTHQHLWVILCCLPEKGRTKTEETVEEMKDRDREVRGIEMKVKKQEK